MESRWIWPFELTEKLGEGGMGVVYRGRYVKNDREVAVKLLPPDVNNSTILQRFEREMEILKSLRHPNIVTCFGGTCEGNQQFYAMELVEGGTLESLLLKQGTLPPGVVMEYALEMCDALAYAHERGIIHRDIKPANFLMTESGTLKLSDFGLATILAGTKITSAGKTVGSYHYMAPEQIRGKELSPQTDLYALGCVLFELVSGEPPFVGESPAEILQKHVSEPAPRLSSRVFSCPVELDQIVSQLLDKDPARRPESAAVVAQALRKSRESVTVIKRGRPENGETSRRTAPPEPSRKREAAAESDVDWGSLSRRSTAWIAPICLIAVALLLISNRMLARQNEMRRIGEEEWLAAFQSNNPVLQVEAARVLGRMSSTSTAALNLLAEGLSSESLHVRQASVQALGNAGPSALPLATRIKRLQQSDPEPDVRHAADAAFRKLSAMRSESSYLWYLFILSLLAGAVLLFKYRKQVTAWLTKAGAPVG